MIDNIENPKIESNISTFNEAPDKPLPLEVVNAVVFNDEGQALVIESDAVTKPIGKWAMVEALITESDDPLTAVQNALLSLTGFQAQRWNYIGTYLKNSEHNEGIGHIFVAQNATKHCEPKKNPKHIAATKWVPVEELRYGLLDGRILSTRYALNVALALLTFPQ
ncbi:MAG: NUDIX domain-containing protein [Chloroflexota bacterium]